MHVLYQGLRLLEEIRISSSTVVPYCTVYSIQDSTVLYSVYCSYSTYVLLYCILYRCTVDVLYSVHGTD